MLGLFSTFVFVFVFVCFFVIVIADVILYPMMGKGTIHGFGTPRLQDSQTPGLQDSQTPGLQVSQTPGLLDSPGVLGLRSSQDGQLHLSSSGESLVQILL